MSVITASDLTFNGKEIQSLSEAVFEQVFEKPALTLFHDVETGIKAKQQIALLGKFEMVGKKDTGCSPAATGEEIAMAEKFWEPERIYVRLVQCWSDIKGTFFVWALKNGLEIADLTRTDFANFINERLDDALFESVLRHAWFGDTDAADVDASPAGLLTSGTDADYWNAIDGLWKQIFAIVAADSNRRYTITENSAGSYSLQDTLAADRAIKTFRALIEGADKRLKGAKGKVIVCTDSLWDNWLTYKESQGMDSSFVRQAEGFETDVYRGVPIIKFDFWDRMIRTYFDNGTTYDRPHRALLITVPNVKIGTEEVANLTEIDQWYEKKEKQTYFDALYSLDAKIIEDYMIQAAY